MSIDGAFNYRKMSKTACTSGLLSEAQIFALGSEGYECVINLLPNDSEYALAGEKTIIEEQGLLYTYIPVDFGAPHKDDYVEFEKSMRALQGKKRWCIARLTIGCLRFMRYMPASTLHGLPLTQVSISLQYGIRWTINHGRVS